MARSNSTITSLVALALVLSTTIVLGAFGLFNYRAERIRLEERLRAEHGMLADQLAVSLALPAWNFDHEQIDKIIQSAMRRPDVVGVTVKLKDRNATVHAWARDAGGAIQRAAAEPRAGGLLTEIRDVAVSDEVVGSVEVWVTTRYMRASLKQSVLFTTVSIVAVDLLLVACLYWLLWRLVLRPVQALERHAAAISDGAGESTRLEGVRFAGELDHLRESLEKMIRLLKKRFEALRASEERFELAVRGSNDGLWDWDVQTNEVYYAPRFRELLGYRSPAEFPPKLETFFHHLHGQDRPRAEAALQEHLLRRAPYDIEFRLCARGGDFRWFRARGQAIWNESGNAVRMAGSITDINPRKKAEASLLESEERFRRVVEFSPEGIYVAVEERVVYLNPAGARMLGASDEAELLGRFVYDFVDPSMHSEMKERRRRVIENGIVSGIL